MGPSRAGLALVGLWIVALSFAYYVAVAPPHQTFDGLLLVLMAAPWLGLGAWMSPPVGWLLNAGALYCIGAALERVDRARPRSTSLLRVIAALLMGYAAVVQLATFWLDRHELDAVHGSMAGALRRIGFAAATLIGFAYLVRPARTRPAGGVSSA